jgi:NCS1 family nucleobase:cation symporter-1
MFLVITIKIIDVGKFSTPNAAHGGALFGGFLLMTTISASFVIPWSAYASDYSRYMKPDTPRRSVFWLTFAGVSISCIWIELLGLAAATVIVNETSAGIQHLVGGGVLGVIALVAIAIGTITVNAVNDYSGSLALQATGARIKRPYVAIVVTVLAFLLTLWLHHGDFATKFTNVLLFITYWIPPFVAVQIVDWRRRGGRPDVTHLVRSDLLRPGWDALAAMAVGFGAAVPFMDTSIYIGYASSHWLQYGDIAFLVGFVVGGAVYALLRRLITKSNRDTDGVEPPLSGPAEPQTAAPRRPRSDV